MKVIIYHNNKCSKSRESYKILEDKGIDFKVINYLESPLSVKELEKLFNMLKIDIKEFIRTNEEEYKIYIKNNSINNHKELFKFISKNPRLLQRPIIVNNNKAVIGRPPERILEIL